MRRLTNFGIREIRGIRSPIDIGFLIGAVALILVGWVAQRSTLQLRRESTWVEHTYEVLRSVDALRANLARPGTDTTLIRLADQLAVLQRLTGDNPAQQRRIDLLRTSLDPRSPARALAVLHDIEREEQMLLEGRKEATNRTTRRSTTVIVLSTMLALVLMAVALSLLHADLSRRQQAEEALGESEAKYRLLMEQAADAILIVNSDAVCVEANARAADILGRPAAEIPGLPLKAFVRSAGPGAGPLLPMLRYGRVTTGEFWVSRPDGKRVAVEIRATMLEDGRVQVIARDISERKEIERVKDEFVSVVSHELRTPLTSIRGALGLLAAGKLDDAPDKRKRMLELAASNTDRLIRLINDILDIERMASGGVAFERADVSLPELVSLSVEAIRPLADRAGVAIAMDVQPLHVLGDSDRLIQTLTNLLDNAIKFSPKNSTVEISVERDGRFARFAVKDRGRGIPRDMLDAVFNRFQQVDNSDSREKGGTGLGLAICRNIVEQHGGRIWVESAVGEGSTFRFTIPLLLADGPATGTETGPRVLVCDDDADLVEVLRTTLGHRGYRVYSAQRGHDAMRAFDELGADIAIIDIVLPDVSGMRVLRHVHAASPRTKIVVYTATYIEGAEKDFIRGIGAVIVTKGRTSPDELGNEIEQLQNLQPAAELHGDRQTE